MSKRYWEMQQFTGKGEKPKEVFKCTACNATTIPEKGFNGEPDKHKCSAKCQGSHGDWKPGDAQPLYQENFDSIFPGAPGSGL